MKLISKVLAMAIFGGFLASCGGSKAPSEADLQHTMANPSRSNPCTGSSAANGYCQPNVNNSPYVPPSASTSP